MPRIKLTERVIPTLKGKPASSGSREPALWFDEDMPGFGVAVSSKTGLKKYFVQRDLPNGKTVRRTIGLVGTEIKTLKEARETGGEMLRGLRLGIDPKTAAKGSLTLAQAVKVYLVAHPNLSSKSQKEFRRCFSAYLADWNALRLSDITAEMVSHRHIGLGEEKGRASANSAMRLLRAVYNHARRGKPTMINPVQLSGQWYRIERRRRLVGADRLKQFYQAVLRLESPVQRDYLLFVLFTGSRRQSAAGLRWDAVDLTERTVTVASKRGGESFKLPVSSFVVTLLRQRRREFGDTEHVFPANSATGHISEPKHPLSLVAEETGIEVSVHDLRRDYITAAESTDVSVMAIKMLVDHSLGRDVTGGYTVMTTARLHDAAERVCDKLKEWCGIKPTLRLRGR
jgi:integrase